MLSKTILNQGQASEILLLYLKGLGLLSAPALQIKMQQAVLKCKLFKFTYKVGLKPPERKCQPLYFPTSN